MFQEESDAWFLWSLESAGGRLRNFRRMRERGKRGKLIEEKAVVPSVLIRNPVSTQKCWKNSYRSRRLSRMLEKLSSIGLQGISESHCNFFGCSLLPTLRPPSCLPWTSLSFPDHTPPSVLTPHSHLTYLAILHFSGLKCLWQVPKDMIKLCMKRVVL